MLANASASDPVTATLGMNAPPSRCSPTVCKPTGAVGEGAGQDASTTWLGASRRKVHGNRTENWLESDL